MFDSFGATDIFGDLIGSFANALSSLDNRLVQISVAMIEDCSYCCYDNYLLSIEVCCS
jgi:hypothetical protein